MNDFDADFYYNSLDDYAEDYFAYGDADVYEINCLAEDALAGEYDF